MNAHQAAALMAAQRSDEAKRFALSTPTELQADVARVFHHVRHHADVTDLQIVLRSLENPVMPPEVEASITNVLKEIRDAH